MASTFPAAPIPRRRAATGCSRVGTVGSRRDNAA
jgi:hypothetical protein